ncbi:hypothetical protein OIU79_017167 [Salix purpurea]|uniref:RING-type domain-containing protein n=1 Tax=Salix purpurea TaxID=77065 RepID=A0A9Q0WVL7_SALPP|nr:hypothetical protein OIU79_017167 [Salix purpurea]KAJ6773644.1 hypothetical protein OIU79_017167 [Salix purpurea]
MGGACCVAARDNDFPTRTGCRSLHGNAGCSPTLSFRWDNRRRVAGEIEDSSYQMSLGVSRDASVEMKGTLGSDRGNLSDGSSPLESFGAPISLKSPVHEGMGVNLMTQPSDLSMETNYPVEVKSLTESPDIADLPLPKIAYSVQSSFSTPTADPLPTRGHPLPPNSTPSRRACRSPGHRLLRQISDSRILGLKSPNNYSLSEGRSSFVLSTCSHDLAMGSHGGSSDGWSMRTFSELVASSQRGRWSFDSEHFGAGFGKTSGCSSRFSYSPSLELQACGACSKFLTEKSVWSSQRIAGTHEFPVVAMLVCGHVYHAECLEATTLEVDKYDPACPICEGGETQVLKMSKKALKTEAEIKAKSLKISRNRVIDSYHDSDFDDLYQQKNAMQDREATKMDPSSSVASSSLKPFLRRHFSLGSKWSRTLSEKRGFWARHRRD